MMNTETVKTNYNDIVMGAPVVALIAARQWYGDAYQLSCILSEYGNLNNEQAACVISALSIRRTWAQNKSLAIQFAQDPNPQDMPIMNAHKTILHNIMTFENPFDALKGLKTNAFAHNIYGDHTRATIDVWMLRAAGLDTTKKPNKTDYLALQEIVREVASEIGESVATTQALIWIIARNGGE